MAVGGDAGAAHRPVLHRELASLPPLRLGGDGAGGDVSVREVGLDYGGYRSVRDTPKHLQTGNTLNSDTAQPLLLLLVTR